MTSLRPFVVLGLASLTFASGASAQSAVPIAQSPLFVAAQVPPLNMLVVGKDHKNYYEAYNDASDLNGDGVLDVGYKPAQIDYFGYFNSKVCYLWDAADNRFEPAVAATNKTCSGAGQWSGDFLNYLTTSRMDALRRVLYGGWRQSDTATDTTLQGAFFPQDAHSWGKEYQSVARDGYNIANYAPLTAPTAGTYHLFAVTTTTDNSAPMLRVLQNTQSRVWNWLSIEGPVAGNSCFTADNSRVSCLSTGVGAGGWALVPNTALSNVQITTWRHGAGHPNNAAEMATFFTTHAIPANRCGTGAVASGQINTPNESNNNPFNGTNGCTHDNYLTEITATLTVSEAGDYRFAVDGDDAVEVAINSTVVAGWYGGHGRNRSAAGLDSHSGTINLSAGTHTVRFRHEEVGGGDNWGLFWQPPNSGPAAGVSRQDYRVRVQVCPSTAALQDDYCRLYPSGVAKPTGILHDYGESEQMMFGLITGSQRNNLDGGVLRRNVLSFKDEIDANTGQFLTTVNGIVGNLDRLRMIGGGYNSSVTDNTSSDTNWNWANGTGTCPSIGGRPIVNGECRMWGNPVGEMLLESMRYYAGAPQPVSIFADPDTRAANSPGGSTAGVNEEATMGLTTETWRNPYAPTASGGLGYLSCAKPYQTIISDINPSYDGDVPGSPFLSGTPDFAMPASVSAFNAAAQGQTIWNHEFGAGSRSVFIGEIAGGANDDAPTAKSASSLGNIRGLAPEEPGKLGTFNTASVARFARVTDVNAAPGTQTVSTFSVALASPLPRIEFPVNGRTVTLIPFAKTVSGTFGGATRKPTNTIVDFYVERIANLPGSPTVAAVNGGRPYAAFRINYEDVEQGNDHDMDAIVRYEVLANADNTVTVRLTSEYAAGSADQNMGYIISGTTADGVYLEVRDVGGPGTPWDLNTPPGATAGQCAVAGALATAPCNQALTLNAERIFTPSAAATAALNLKDPLWFAAKYGGFKEDSSGGNNLPDGTEWDADGDGVPDNYFLVTNPLQLRTQLSAAFDSILADEKPAGGLANTGGRLGAGAQEFEPKWQVDKSERDWTGDLVSYRINPNGTRGVQLWSAKEQLATKSPSGRRIFTTQLTGPASTHAAAEFITSGPFTGSRAIEVGAIGLTEGEVNSRFGATITGDDLFDYFRGDQSKEQSTPGGVFRTRSALIGSIINSEPEVSLKNDVFRWINVADLRSGYQTYIAAKRAAASRPNLIMVGSNNGYMHAFNTANGEEVFAYLPASARRELGDFAQPTFTHRYLMDGDLTAVDAQLGGTWSTVVVGSTGRGGRSVFALDITTPQSFSANDVLWELEGGAGTGQNRDLGHVIGRTQVMYGEDGNWYAVFGNGVNSENSNPVLMVVNLATGVATSLTANDGGDLTNGLINVAMVDADGNGKIDAVYGGDLQGNLWKFDVSSTTPSSWGVAFSGNPLFTAEVGGVRQPITGGIDVARGAGGLMVYFGSGRYLTGEDAETGTAPQMQTLYGVRDNGTQSGGVRGNLQAQEVIAQIDAVRDSRTTSNNPVNYGTQRGWYLDLAVGGTAAGERFVGDPDVRGGVVFFPTLQTGNDRCNPGAQNWIYGIDAITGSSALGGTASIAGGTVCGASCGAVQASSGAPIRSAVFTQQAAVCRPGIDPGCSTGVPTPEAIAAACTGKTGADLQACIAGLTSGPSGPNAAGAQTRCGEVERHTGAVFERACGRQSWRQVR
jgi:type IV pilus assembly protein PilY1